MDLNPPLDLVLPPGTDQPILQAVFEVSPSALPNDTSALAISEEVGTPPTAAVFVSNGGIAYYPELVDHPLTMTNPRGIYFDHISHHILMFVMALSSITTTALRRGP